VKHAVISADESAGGMFRRWPFFQRLLSWTKPYAPFERGTREYERYDWNSLLAADRRQCALMTGIMDGTSYYPSRPEMERNLVAFAEGARVEVRYGCRWTGTRRDADRWVLETNDGEYRCQVPIFAVGVAEPWRPQIPGIEGVPHYAETRPAETYAGRRVFIVGKENSGFELATGFLQWAKQIVLASPSPAKLSINTRSLVGVRARYVQPYEDHVLAGGVIVLDASIERIERTGDTFRVHTRKADSAAELVFEVDDVIAATGFTSQIQDLTKLGVATVGRNKLPAQTPFWESASVPGVYFGGTIQQASPGLRKHGMPSNSGGVNGHRYNGRILARHVARTHFHIDPEGPVVPRAEVVSYLLNEVTNAPELWHQKSYLARVLIRDEKRGVVDDGILPLQSFLDSGPADAVAATLEENTAGDIYPVLYTRRAGVSAEHDLGPHPLHDFRTREHERAVVAALEGLLL
jgi:thioredoxin reductase